MPRSKPAIPAKPAECSFYTSNLLQFHSFQQVPSGKWFLSVVNDSERSNSPRLAFGWILPLVSLHTMKSPGLFANQATPFEGMPCIISTTPATRLHNPGYFPRSASQAQGRRRNNEANHINIYHLNLGHSGVWGKSISCSFWIWACLSYCTCCKCAHVQQSQQFYLVLLFHHPESLKTLSPDLAEQFGRASYHPAEVPHLHDVLVQVQCPTGCSWAVWTIQNGWCLWFVYSL